MSPHRVAIALTALFAAVGPLSGQQPGAPPPQVTLRLGPGTLVLRTLAALRPGGWLGPATTPALVAGWWEAETQALIARARAGRARVHLQTALGLRLAVPPDTGRRRIAIPRPADVAQREAPTTFRGLGRYADLGIDLRARLEMKFDRLRNANCTAVDVSNPASGCQGGFPTPSFDQQIRVLARGVVGDRFHVNVDFDTEREFSVNNNINVWYQGLEDEILRRVEVGNVTFAPPASRFITAGIPSNSFGVLADAQLGALEFSGIYAQQTGSAVRTRTFRVGETTTQPVNLEARDLDFESGRFFFVLNPLELPAYPSVDILSIERGFLPLDQRLTGVRIYRLRAQAGRDETNANLGGIDAIAVRDDSQQRVGPFTWEVLVEGRDYYLDPSGVWFAMASRIGTDDFLAVSYTTASGDTVGTFPVVNGQNDTLQLIYEPRSGTDVPTFFYEMRNVYRIGGTSLDRTTLELTIVVNESERPLGGANTYLSVLGLALPTDQSTIDEFNRVFPRLRDPNDGAPVRDLYVVFPHLTPFADSVRLQPGDLNDSLYKTPTYLRITEGPPPKFHMRFKFEATGAGDRSTLSLGALQIRDRSEKLFIGNRELVRDRDYEIDYQLGTVTFLHPDLLFVGPTEVRAQFEENQLFDSAPKSIFGLSATYNLGRESRLHAVGIVQRDRTSFTRPQLGFEPQAGFMGGVTAELLFRAEGLTQLLDALPLIETTVPSRLEINGEVAMSNPNPNRTGIAYVDDFQAQSALNIRLVDRDFQLGSAPTSGQGLPASHLGTGGEFLPQQVVPMVWQNGVQTVTGALEFEPQEIDSAIVLAGSGVRVEPVLWLSLKPDTVGGAPDPSTGQPRWFLPHTSGPRWRSISQPFGFGSGVGVDLSRVEFIEFWVLEDAEMTARQQNAMLVLDFGTVQEDVVGTAPESFRVADGDTTFSGFRFVGVDVLDTERDTITNTYNALMDDIGILGDLLDSIVEENTGDVIRDFPMCDLGNIAGLPVFPLGDLATTCTRRNSRFSTEDLNGDNRLDKALGVVEEDLVRLVYPIGDQRFYVRDGVTHLDGLGRPLTWRLYRLPFRVDTTEVGQPDIRQIQAFRMTLVAPDQGPEEVEFWVALARMRLVGAPWLRRTGTPIAGISGKEGQFHGEVRVSVASTEDQQLGYEPPPGTIDLPEQTGQAFELGVTQINEKSLRVIATDIREGERAAAFIRYTGEADKNFLNYRKLRVWARGRGDGWGPAGDLEFFIKVGRDEDNFYLYHAPSRTDNWEPEVVIDLERWLRLRAEIEQAWLAGQAPSGAETCGLGDSTAFVRCDGPYLVQVKDPGITPPNLARVSEVATGMLRVGAASTIDVAEVWVDDIRLSDVVDDAGFATALDLRLSGADVLEFDFGFTRRDDRFRQLDERPTYVTDAVMRIGGVFRVEKLLPQAWGLSLPVGLRYTRSGSDPFFLQNTDIRADVLTGLREPDASATSWDITLRRIKRGGTFVERAFVDPIVIQLLGDNAKAVSTLSSSTMRNRAYRIGYNTAPGPRTIAGAPKFLVNLVNSLPDFIKESEFGRALRNSRLRWNPAQLTFNSVLTNNITERLTFRVPVRLESDDAIQPIPSIVHTWRNEIRFSLRPYSSFGIRVFWGSTRDIQDYGDSTAVGRLIERERRKFLGADVGYERRRTLTTSLNLAPPVSSWLRPRLVLGTVYNFNRDPNRNRPVRLEGDTAGALKVPETLSNSRRTELGASVDLARLWQGIAGDSGFVASLLRGILPADVSWQRDLRSSFDRAPFDADLAYRLAFGGLDDFRQQNGVPATAAGETETVLLTAGSRLPLSAQFRLTYRNLRRTGWARRGDVQSEIVQRNREWPLLTFSWAYSPGGVLRRLIPNITAQLQYRAVRASTVQPAVLGLTDESSEVGTVTTENNSTLLSPSLTLALPVGVTVSGQYSLSQAEAVTAGNVTESEREEWGANLNFAWRVPQRILRLRNRIQTTLAYNTSLLAVCILQVGAEGCRTVSDSRRDQVDFRMGTGVSETVRGGITFSYVLTNQRHLSRKLSQIVFSIFGEFSFRAGQLR